MEQNCQSFFLISRFTR